MSEEQISSDDGGKGKAEPPGCNLPLALILLALPGGVLALVWGTADHDLLSYGGLAGKCALAAAVVASLAWRLVYRPSLGLVFAAPFWALTFGLFLSLSELWNASEPGEPFFLEARVLEKRFTRSQKGNSRNIAIAPGLDGDPELWFDPGETIFAQAGEGDMLRMTLRRGRLGYCWVERVEVVAAPPARSPRRKPTPPPQPTPRR